MALVLTVVLRALYVIPALHLLERRARRGLRHRDRLRDAQARLSSESGRARALARMARRVGDGPARRRLDRFTVRVRRGLADMDYFLAQPLGRRERAVVVWAGMRGAVTVAASQTLPLDTPHRPTLVFVAFAVALGSLLLQGGTMPLLVARLSPGEDEGPEEADRVVEHRERIAELLAAAAAEIPAHHDDPSSSRRTRAIAAARHRLTVIASQRRAVLEAREAGTIDGEELEETLADLDASQVATEIRIERAR